MLFGVLSFRAGHEVISRAKVESRALRSLIINEIRFSEVGSPLTLVQPWCCLPMFKNLEYFHDR